MYLWCEIAVYLPCEWITVKIRWSQYNASLPPWTNNVMIALQRGKDWFGTGSISLPIFILDSDNIHHIKCWNIYIQAISMIPDGKIYIFRQYLKYQMSKYFYQIHIVYMICSHNEHCIHAKFIFFYNHISYHVLINLWNMFPKIHTNFMQYSHSMYVISNVSLKIKLDKF